MILNSADDLILESNKTLSQSLIWQLQRNFFEQEGMGAWNTGKVPHYVTSNPFIANAYGEVIKGFLRDCLRDLQNPFNLKQPIYIV